MAVPAKEKHRATLLNYLGNPENPFPNRVTMATEILGYKYDVSLYKTFTVAELDEIEREALEIRRKKYKPGIAAADKALLKEAKGGNVHAIKLVYQRFDDWNETHTVEAGDTLKDFLTSIDGKTRGLPKENDPGES